jgi:hypothetical protein
MSCGGDGTGNPKDTPPTPPLIGGILGEFVQFLSHAEGSLAEMETQILISVDLDFCSKEEANQALAQIEELQRMLNSLRQKLATRH